MTGAVYVPENVFLPEDLIDEIGLTGKLAGSKRNRVKAIRLRGETPRASCGHLSQPADRGLETGHRDGTDFSGELGITEWIRRSRST